MESDGRLARVTYLPGVQPPSDPPTFAGTFGIDAGESAASSAFEPAPETDADTQPDPRLDEDESADALARQHDRAENVSMHALTRRGLSRRELERTLRARELDDEVIAGEIERLERVGLIDDLALAQNLVGILQERKGLGRSGIAAELARRMLSPAAIEYALELVDTGDELGRAREIAVKRAGQLSSYDHETAVRRLSAFLARRGYSGSTVRAAVEHALPRRAGNSVRFR
jgi:regulatory protein